MPTAHQFKWFGIVMALVCVPFFVLIGSLNTTSGMEFWRKKWHQFIAWITRNPMPVAPTDDDDYKDTQGKIIALTNSLSIYWLISRRSCEKEESVTVCLRSN
jgi:hypothetical protein